MKIAKLNISHKHNMDEVFEWIIQDATVIHKSKCSKEMEFV